MPDLSAVDRLWSGWRSEWVAKAAGPDVERKHGSVFADLFHSDLPDEETNIVWRGKEVFAILNAFPYGTGHLLVMPIRVVGEIEQLTPSESAEIWSTVNQAVVAVKTAYNPDGVNIGFNLGAAAGAGIPGHLHGHVLPRWAADSNFMSAVANARVLPEALSVTREKLSAAWP